MKQLSTRAHLALGQTGILVSLMLAAIFLGLVPDRDSAVREGRAALAEALAVNSSLLVGKEDIHRLGADLRLIVERNEDVRSAALRTAGGQTLLTVGDHDAGWSRAGDRFSTDTQVQVPIMAGSSEWGRIEMLFEPTRLPGLRGLVETPWVRLVAFIALASSIVFYFYLGKMLKQLDPSQAIPSRVRSALDTMAEGLLVVDSRANVVLANQAFADLVGQSADALLGRRVADFPWTRRDGVPLEYDAFPWVRALTEGVPQKKIHIGLRDPAANEAGLRIFMVNCSPVFAGAGKVGGVLVSLDDITQLNDTEIMLRQSRDEAEAANRAKSEFIANVSHEIRTPMNAILGFTEVLKRGYGGDGGDYRRHLSTIASSGKHLLELINDILDLSKAESGRLVIEKERLQAHRVIADVVRILEVKAQEKGISLTFSPAGPLPESVLSDAAMFRQIVTNLIGNAVKFTDQGGVEVTARLRRDGDRSLYEIAVTDSGIGMSEDKTEAVFEPFVQADSSVTRRFGGTGLGLAICRKYARALGGDTVATSTPGVGSTFTATIATGPLEAVELLKPAEVLAAVEALPTDDTSCWEFPSARVLVVDDGPENRELLELVLREMNLTVVTANDGLAGSERAAAEPFDVILMDVQMPVMDGFTAARRMRDAGITVPILALTAHAMKGFEVTCLEAGYSEMLTKPIEFERLFEVLARLLGGRRLAQPQGAATAARSSDAALRFSAAAAATPDEGDTGIAPAHLETAPIASRLAGRERLRPAIARFVERLAEQVDAMDAALEADDWSELGALAHWLKGAGGTVGFDVFTEPARRLEEQAHAADQVTCGAIVDELRWLAGRLERPPTEITESSAA